MKFGQMHTQSDKCILQNSDKCMRPGELGIFFVPELRYLWRLVNGCFVADISSNGIVGKHKFVLKLNRINGRVRVSILESIMYKSKEKVGILGLK